MPLVPVGTGVHTLQSVDPTKLNARSSEVALRLRPAPPGARRGEPAAALLPVERERARDEEEVAPPPAEVSVRLRLGPLGASLLPWVTTLSCLCQSRRG